MNSTETLALLHRAAIDADLLAIEDPAPDADGVTSEAAAAAIEALLDQVLVLPPIDDAACRRHHAAHAARFAVGERVQLRHILFAVTPGVDVNALRQRAEACLLDLRAPATDEANRFASVAGQLSNCPSGAQGGELGWLTASDCAPEFAREVLGHPEVGVLARLVHSRFGLHVVEVLARQAGEEPPFEAVQAAVRMSLERQACASALREYLAQLQIAA